ncbi:cytochrome bc1 complex cytochrome b subunit [Streptomyces sp. O3]
MSTTDDRPRAGAPAPRGERVADYVDGRFGTYRARVLVRKAFPEHWSFMFGEMALYSFVILILTGIYLTLFFKPSMTEVIYDGAYVPLQGVTMSEAYASTVDISFDVRGGLFIRQVHHWAALTMVAAVCLHTLRHFFTGSFRKPREINWVIGFVLLVLVILEGFAGYSLPDDLLSGTGLRIVQGVTLAIPVVGTYLHFFIFGGEYPGDDVISRLYSVHILLIPGIMLGLIVLHVLYVGIHKHTQFRGPGRTEKNVIGQPLVPVYVAKAGGFFFAVFGVLALIAGLVTINPVWKYGPYRPDHISQGSQPDWYMGFLEGALRAMPAWEFSVVGYTVNMGVLLPAVVLPGLMALVIAGWPFLEAWVSGDRREHHLLDRPREHPTRTAFGCAFIAFYLVLFFGGANDILSEKFHLNLNSFTWAVRIGLFVAPVITYVVTKRICLALQLRDREKLLHGRETGKIMRLPHGEFVEVHERLDREREYSLLSREVLKPLPAPEPDSDDVPNPRLRRDKLRHRLSRWMYGAQVPTPTPEQYEQALEHLEPGDHTPAALNGHDPTAEHAKVGPPRTGDSAQDPDTPARH